MTATLTDVQKRAFGLPAADRERLADELLHSLAADRLSDLNDAWVREAERRLDALLAGKTRGIPADKALASVRRELRYAKRRSACA